MDGMARRKTRLAAIIKKGRDLAHSATYTWLWDNAQIVEDALVQTNAIWAALAETMASDGVLTSSGNPPCRRYVRQSWSRVSVDLAADREAKKLLAERAGHRSRRTKGWVPPSSAPAQPSPVPAGPRRDTTLHPHVAVAAPATPASPAAPPRSVAAPPSGPAGPHILGAVTPEEAEYLAPFSDRSENTRLQLLTNFRTMAHMDRFNRPLKK